MIALIDYMGNRITASPQNMINLMLVVEYLYKILKKDAFNIRVMTSGLINTGNFLWH